MSTFDRKAMIELSDREYDESVERMRIKDKDDMYPIWGCWRSAFLHVARIHPGTINLIKSSRLHQTLELARKRHSTYLSPTVIFPKTTPH